MSIGLFLDTCNLYHCIKHKYGSHKKVDFAAYHKYVEDIGRVVVANAYGARFNKNTDKFIKSLEEAGYTAVYKEVRINQDGTRRANQNVNICLDSMGSAVKTVVLGSSDNDLVPLVKRLKSEGKRVVILSCTIGQALEKEADVAIEIPYTFLRGK